MKVGDTVIHKGQVWGVTELVTGVGGAELAQLENLDLDAFAAVAVDGLTPHPLSKKDIEERIRQREERMAPVRAAHQEKLAAKVAARKAAAGGES